jgi:hypothetical protein
MILQVVNGNMRIYTHITNERQKLYYANLRKNAEQLENPGYWFDDIYFMLPGFNHVLSMLDLLQVQVSEVSRPNKLSVLPHSGHPFAHVHRP